MTTGIRRPLGVRLATGAALLALLGSACGDGGPGEELRMVRSALDRTDLQSREFTYAEVTDEQRVVVRGREEDDLRYQATVSIDGTDVFEGIISEDALALRLVDPQAAPQVVETAMGTDEELGEALAEGRWVLDFTAAPPVVPERGSEGELGLGRNAFLDAFYLPKYLDDAVLEGAGMTRFNPEGLDYNPRDDPWAEDADRNLQDRGLQRFDLLLPPLPRRSERGTQQALPSVEHFRKMAFYLKGRSLVEVREQIDIDDRQEFRRAAQGRAAEYYLELLDAARGGYTQEPVRERRMRYEVRSLGSADPVRLPDEAVTGTMGPIVGSSGLGSLFADPSAPRQPSGPDDLPPGIVPEDDDGSDPQPRDVSEDEAA